MKLILPLLFLVLHVVARPTSPPGAAQIHDLSIEAFQQAYHYNIGEAERLFDQASALDSLHPRPIVGRAMIEFWRFLLSKDEQDRKRLFDYADRAIEAAERYEDTYGEAPETKLCLGTAYAYRSFAYGRVKSYLKAAWDAKKSYDRFTDALRLDPKLYDAYLGIGMFHYALAFIPKPLQWVASIAGIDPDPVNGLREIKVAAGKGVFSRTEARYFLAQLLPWQDGDFTSSENILENLSREYPENALLKFTLAVWQIRRNDPASARSLLTDVVNGPDGALPAIRTFALYKLGEAYFRLNDYPSAKTAYSTFLASHHDQTYVATASLRTGICFLMEGNRDSAAARLTAASRSDRHFGDDAYSTRQAKRFLSGGFSTHDSLLVLAQNALRSGAYTRAVQYFSGLKTVPSMEAEATYGLGETLFEQALYAEALAMFQAAASIPQPAESWVTPWAHYMAGKSELKLGNPQSAKKHFEQALDFEDYDFSNWLEFRSRRELEQIPH